MGTILLDNLAAGMILASDVHDRAGRMLLGAGSELTAKHLVIFRTWGVAEVQIVGEDDGSPSSQLLPPELTAEQLVVAESALAPLFATTNLDHPAMAELFRLAALRKALHDAH